MAYLTFYNPYYFANRDEKSDSSMDQLNRSFNQSCGCSPSANVYESETEYRIEMAIPGLAKEDIRIKHENGLLSVSVENKEASEDNYSHREFNYSGTGRVFKTGNKVNYEQISAKYENGILLISLPKKEEFVKKPAQEIEVQ